MKQKANIPKAVALASGSVLFLEGIARYGPQIDRLHHWQLGAALLFIGILL